MITLLPMTKPNLGLSVTRDSLCLVEIRRNWRGMSCRHISESILPAGTLRLSPARPNIENVNEFVQSLRTLIKHVKLPQSVALSLPDLCGRSTVLHFPSFPTKKTEQDSIVEWKFQQDMNLSTNTTRFSYRTFSSPKNQPSTRQVLATAIQQDIVEQYEQACLEVGLLPNSVGFSGLDVCDLYQPKIHEGSRRMKQPRRADGEEYLFLYLANWGISFMAFRDDHPTFLRVKALPIPRLNQNCDSASNPEPYSDETLIGGHEVGEAANQDLAQGSSVDINSVSNELVATLQYYFESQPFSQEAETPIPLYIAEGVRLGESLFPTEQTIGTMLRASLLHPPSIMIQKISDSISPRIKKAIMRSEPQMNAFSAYASVTAIS